MADYGAFFFHPDLFPRLQNFDQVVNGNQYALVYFFSPTCDVICKALAPEFAAAASQLASLGNKAVMGKVDADSTPGGRALAARFGVTGFPTLIWFENGKPLMFTGLQKDRSDLVFWVATKSDVITQVLTFQVCACHFCLLPFRDAN